MKKLSYLIILAAFILGPLYVISSVLNEATHSRVPKLSEKEDLINITTPDNFLLHASYLPGPKKNSPAILLLHGNGASRAQFKTHFNAYNEAGYAVLTIDFRGHGHSQTAPKSYGLYESIDAKAAFDWLKNKQQGAKIAVLGVSLGGAAALMGDNGPLPADAMILQAVFPNIRHAIGNRIKVLGGETLSTVLEPALSYQSYLRYDKSPDEISPLKAAGSYDGSTFLIGGGNDLYTPPNEVETMHQVFKDPKHYWIVPNLDHAQISSLDDEAYIKRTLEFFDENLK